MYEAKNNFNKQINEYLSDVKKCVSNYKEMIKKNNIDKESVIKKTGVIPLRDNSKRFYDIRKIENGHKLSKLINKNVFLGKEDKNGVVTYLKYAGVVFDDDSYNFHIFPNEKKCYVGDKGTRLNEQYTAIQSALKNKLKYKISELCSKHIEDEETRFLLKNLAISKICVGNPNFKLMGNILALMEQGSAEKLLSSDDIKIFCRYVGLETLTSSYYIQLMRLTCKEYKQVGCTLCAIQFHKECIKGINKGKNENGKVVFDICYPNTADDEDRSTNSAGNVCYNPTVFWPRFNEKTKKYSDTDIGDIINKFINFIVLEEKKEIID